MFITHNSPGLWYTCRLRRVMFVAGRNFSFVPTTALITLGVTWLWIWEPQCVTVLDRFYTDMLRNQTQNEKPDEKNLFNF